jgi:hypothetical protein
LLIKPRDENGLAKKAVSDELQRALEAGPVPDPVCCPDCPEYSPARGCYRNCPFAPSRLSSEPEAYPLEQMVTPVVFELKRLGIFTPCWSCEGHNDPAGNLWKIPRVWFYSDSVVHVRALANAMHELFLARRLSASWIVNLTFSHPDNPDTTFSLEPKFSETLFLPELQNDLKNISEGLHNHFYQSCDQLRDQAC